MDLTRLTFHPLTFITSLINLLSVKSFKKQQQKTHDYTKLVYGTDYIFEWLEERQQAQMTAQGRGIKSGDRIILKNYAVTEIYTVEEIDYYSNPSDMWMGLLCKEQ